MWIHITLWLTLGRRKQGTPAEHDVGRDNLSLTLQVPNTWQLSLWTVLKFMILETTSAIPRSLSQEFSLFWRVFSDCFPRTLTQWDSVLFLGRKLPEEFLGIVYMLKENCPQILSEIRRSFVGKFPLDYSLLSCLRDVAIFGWNLEKFSGSLSPGCPQSAKTPMLRPGALIGKVCLNLAITHRQHDLGDREKGSE